MSKIVMSGMRPTGKLHLGHWEGALRNWLTLQDKYPCFFSVADWHALTTGYNDTSMIKEHVNSIVLDYLSAGVDPEKCCVFRQSAIKAIPEIYLMLSMVTPLGWLERVPTFKEQQQQLKDRDINNIGFLGYPLLQAVDIICVRADTVPVGEDQVFHIELAREIARRFNNLYGEFFAEPKEFLTPIPKLPGLDGRKMSKSYDNSIYLSDSSEVVEKKIRPMVTDTRRKRRTDPGVPAECPVFDFHKSFSSEEERSELSEACQNAGIGCIDCKKVLIKNLNNFLDPFRERRSKFENCNIDDILESGNIKAAKIAEETAEGMRQLMKL